MIGYRKRGLHRCVVRGLVWWECVRVGMSERRNLDAGRRGNYSLLKRRVNIFLETMLESVFGGFCGMI